MAETSRPTVGRIVHYVSYGTPGGEYGRECRAAIVTEVPAAWDAQSEIDQPIGLAVLNPTGMFFNRGCKHDEGSLTPLSVNGAPPTLPYPGGTWHWPERA